MQFGSTVWEAVRRAKQKDDDAVRQLVSKYREPVIDFLRRAGVSAHDAEDLAQETFLRLFTGDALANVDPANGKFRTLLIGFVKNVTREWLKRRRAEKRGGGSEVISIEALAEDSLVVSEERFARTWFVHLVSLAIDRLRQSDPADPSVRALELFMTKPLDYSGVARELGCSVAVVTNYLHRARLKLAERLREEISAYSLNQADYESDLRQATDLLEGKP